MKLFYKLVFMGCFTLIGIIFYLYQWRSPNIRKDLEITYTKVYEYIKNHSQGKQQSIQSMEYMFDVYYIENTPLESFNPYFPIIYITNNLCNGWFHLVRTDAKFQTQYQCFIDASSELYPFYSKGNMFSDQPQWNYEFFTKPLSFWIGHAWAIQVNEKDKTIKCLGGIQWGYRLLQFAFKPAMILPSPLTKQDWQIDWQVFQEVLPEYKNI